MKAKDSVRAEDKFVATNMVAVMSGKNGNLCDIPYGKTIGKGVAELLLQYME